MLTHFPSNCTIKLPTVRMQRMCGWEACEGLNSDMCRRNFFCSASYEKQCSRTGQIEKRENGNKRAFGVHGMSMERQKLGIIGM